MEQEESTPQPDKPQASSPQVRTPQVRTPQADKPQASSPQVRTPQADKPQASSPQVRPPQAGTLQADKPQASSPQVRTPQAGTHSGLKLKRKVLTVYMFLLSGVILTALTMEVFFQVETIVNIVRGHFFVIVLATTLLMTLVSTLFNRTSYNEQKGSKILLWGLNCILPAIPLLYLDPGILMRSFLYTTIIFLILTLKAFIVPEKVVEVFLYPMTAIHPVVLICTIYSIFLGSLENTISLIITSISLHGGFLIYSGLLICNTQRLTINIRHPRFDPLFSSFVLFMNFINIYARVAIFSAIETSVVKTSCT